MSEPNKHPALGSSAAGNAFIGPGNTNLGPGPVIPDSMPSAAVRHTYNDDRQPRRQPSQGTPGTGSKPNTDGRARLGSDVDERAERPDPTKLQAEPKKDPLRGPMGMSTTKKSSFGTPGTGPKPNADGRNRLGSDAEDHFSFDEGKEVKHGQEGGVNNPWRGPLGMKLGHGPRVDHLEKNEDGSFKLKQDPASGPQGE